MRFKCFLSEDEISSKSYIIVLQPERNKYLKWELPSPQATADLIKSENIKLPVKSYTIFKLNCASAIRESHNFITDTREVEIIKTTIAIWNCAEENIKEKYNQLNMNLRDLESPAHSELPEVTPEVVAQDCKINLVSPSTKLSLEWELSPIPRSTAFRPRPRPFILINFDLLRGPVSPIPRGSQRPPKRTENSFLLYRNAFRKELERILEREKSLVKREKSKREALKWNKIFNTEFIPIRRVLQLSECRKERKKVLKREFRAIKKALLQECEKERKKVLKSELRKVMKVLRLSERSPVAYSLNLFQQLDKDIFGTIKRGIEELEKTKVAKCNQEGYCENCGTKYTQIMTVDAKRKRRFQIKTQRLVRERESADEEDQIFNNQRFEQVNANNTAKMGSEVWQNLYEGTDCPQEFHKKVYAHNDRLVKDTSNAQEANQQTCRQCKNRFMCEQNYISDYVRDAHQKHEFHKKQIYEHEPKESGEVDSMNKISYNHSMNDINGDQVMVHEFPYQKQIYERDFQPHMQHEPKEKIVNQTFNLDNTINEAICGYNNYAHDVQSPEREVDSMNEINNSINEAICDYNNHAHDVQSPHQKQIYEHEFQQHEPKEKKVNQTFNLNNTINEAICDYNNHAHDVQFPHQKQIYEHEPKIDAAIDEAICDYNNHVHDSKFPLQKQIYEHEREVDSMNAINNSINEAISNYAHDVQFPHQKQIYEHEPKIDAAIDEASDYNNHVHDVQFLQFPSQKQIYEREPNINNDCNNHAHDVQKQTYEYEPKASGEVNSMNEVNNTINEAICDYNNHVYDVQFPLQKQIYKHEPKEKGDIDATNRPGYCYNNGTEKKDIKAFGLIKKTMEIYALDGQDYETINLGSNIFRETLAKDYPISQKRIQFKLGHCYDKVETETLKLIKRLNHSQDDILDAKQILNVLRFHTYSLFKNVFHNGIRKKLAFRKKNYCSRINRRNRRRYNPNLSIYRTKRC